MVAGQSSASDLERTRASFVTAAARDVDALMRMFRASSVWDVTRWGLGSHTGLSAIRRSLQDWIGVMDEYAVDVEELSDLGNGVILAVAVQRARPAGSRARLHLRYAPGFIWADGWAERVTHYRDVDEARGAAKLAARARSASPGAQAELLPAPGGKAAYQA